MPAADIAGAVATPCELDPLACSKVHLSRGETVVVAIVNIDSRSELSGVSLCHDWPPQFVFVLYQVVFRLSRIILCFLPKFELYPNRLSVWSFPMEAALGAHPYTSYMFGGF
jgi:hypothetical protein